MKSKVGAIRIRTDRFTTHVYWARIGHESLNNTSKKMTYAG